MDYSKKRWLILLASCLMALCVGSLYAWSVFASPMTAYLEEITGNKIASLAIIFTVANSVGPITMIAGGYLNDKLGPKLVLFIGGILFGLGMIGSGFATSVPMLVVTYGLGVGLGVGMVYGTVVSNAVKFFPDKSGLAGGLTTACYGGSSIIIPIIATMLLEKYSITSAFKILGIVMTIIICVSTLVVEACPKDYSVGLPKNASDNEKKATAPSKEYNYKEMLRSKDFYYMLILLMCGAFAGMMIISQASPIAQNLMEFTSAAAAAVVSILALFNMLGRMVSGMLSDKLGALGTLQITFAISFAASILLFFTDSSKVAFFYIGIACIGFCFGSIMGIYPGFTAKKFGRKHNSVNYGIMFIGFALAGLFGPTLMNTIYGSSGKYQFAFLVAGILAVVGEVIILRLKKNES